MTDKLLIVHLEDEGALREIVCQMISYLEKDIELEQFSNAEEVIEYLKDPKDVAAFLLDVRVPGKMNGLQLAEHVRESGHDCPIFIVSAYETPEGQWLKEWNCKWMPKPTHALDLRRKILPQARAYATSKGE